MDPRASAARATSGNGRKSPCGECKAVAQQAGELAHPRSDAEAACAASSDPDGIGMGRSRSRTRRTQMAAIDPVCGMTVEEADAPAKADHDGTTYYFCSSDCREEFEANPQDYAS